MVERELGWKGKLLASALTLMTVIAILVLVNDFAPGLIS